MQLEVGKYYKTRDGQRVGPLTRSATERPWPWFCSKTGLYSDTGNAMMYTDRDLIEEWPDVEKIKSKAPSDNWHDATGYIQHKDPTPYEIAAQHKIIVTVTKGDITITYDGRDQ